MFRRTTFLSTLSVLFLLLTALPAAAQDQFMFGVILVGPKDDHGWSQAHFEGGQYAEAHVAGTKMLMFEKLNSADSPETHLIDVVTEMVEKGAKLIITTSDDFEDDTPAAAKAFPNVTFVNIGGSQVINKGAPPNLGNYDAQVEWSEEISGCAAALITQTGKIGYLGPLINPKTRRLAASAYLGARYCYENYARKDPTTLSFTVTWIGNWFNIPGVTLDPTAEANTFFDKGADVVMSALDSPEALQVASQRSANGQKVFAAAYDYREGCDAAPEVCLGVAYYNWGPYYTRLVQAVKDGTWTQSWDWEPPSWANINDADVSPTGFLQGNALSADNAKLLGDFIAEMTNFGTDPANKDRIFLWRGPLTYQDDSGFLADGEFAKPLDIWKLPKLLKGMIGASS